jgi:hypothetical protein
MILAGYLGSQSDLIIGWFPTPGLGEVALNKKEKISF